MTEEKDPQSDAAAQTGAIKPSTAPKSVTTVAENSSAGQAAESTSEEKKKPAKGAHWIGFDLGGTKIQCTLFNDSMKIVESRRRRTRSELGEEGLLDRIASTIEKVLNEAELSVKQLGGIGIGCPGPVEWEKGVVRVAVNLGWENVAVGKYLEKRFDCPVAVMNDVDAGVYGEYCDGAAKGARSAVGIFPGTGIGGGCVYDGQILRGKTLTCMEIGHTKLNGSGRPGGTGMLGTLETEASRLAVAGELAKLAYRGEAPHLLKAAGTDISEIRSKTIADAIADGDKEVEAVIERACEMLGFSVANMVLLICPDVVVLGGGLVEAMPDRFVKAISKVARSNVFECYRDEFEVRAAKLGDDAATVGAAAYVRKQVESQTAGK